ncbi:MAG: thioredoxin-dependent thiol peroxidase [Pseudomonadota bacterium]
MISEGQSAPDFTLPCDSGETLTLNSLKGKTVVLYFYPKDDTSGCTKQAIAFSEMIAEFAELGAEIIGVSPDSVKKHDKFKEKHGLKVKLVSDEEKSLVETYGVWVEKQMYGKKYMGVERSTFLIDPKGKIIKIWRKVKVPGHAEHVLNEIKNL